MRRHELSAREWAVLGPLLDTHCRKQGGASEANRLFINAVLWRMRTGIPWRDLPERFGHWNSVARRFARWARKKSLASAVSRHPGAGLGVGAGRFHRRQGAPAGSRPKKSSAEAEALGRSRSGLTTKVHAAVDALGNPVHVHLSGGQEADCQHFAPLADVLPTDVMAVVGDKGYDTNAVLARIAEAGAEAVVPAKKNRCQAREIDENLYRDRNKVERFFLKIK